MGIIALDLSAIWEMSVARYRELVVGRLLLYILNCDYGVEINWRKVGSVNRLRSTRRDAMDLDSITMT